ncbi:MAG: biotin--[acetyl-CoA-carboxylase] ligase [Nitrospinaceae bacterium]
MNRETIKNNLQTILIGSEVIVMDEVDSTNDVAKRYLEKDAHDGLVIIANSQSRGKGRLKRSWISVPEVGIYLSVILKPRISPDHIPQLTLLAGVAAVSAVNAFSRTPARLKWPNDILLKGKKLCGVLCEYCPPEENKGGIVMGIGINVNHGPSQFPEDLRNTATSLKIENGEPVDRLALILSVLNHLDQEYEAYLLGGEQQVIKKWADHSDMFGKHILLTQGSSSTGGTAVGLDSLGRLKVLTDDGREQVFDSGEVTLSLP